MDTPPPQHTKPTPETTWGILAKAVRAPGLGWITFAKKMCDLVPTILPPNVSLPPEAL